MPNSKVADELEPFCTIGKCEYFNNWLNELYLFEAQYKIYRSIKGDGCYERKISYNYKRIIKKRLLLIKCNRYFRP